MEYYSVLIKRDECVKEFKKLLEEYSKLRVEFGMPLKVKAQCISIIYNAIQNLFLTMVRLNSDKAVLLMFLDEVIKMRYHACMTHPESNSGHLHFANQLKLLREKIDDETNPYAVHEAVFNEYKLQYHR